MTPEAHGFARPTEDEVTLVVPPEVAAEMRAEAVAARDQRIDEEERRLSIELSTAQRALPVVEGHREPRGSDAATSEQPDMLQTLDLLQQGSNDGGGGLVKPTEHYERAAQAAVAGGAPAALSISLAEMEKEKRPAGKEQSKAKKRRRARTVPGEAR